MKYFFLFMCLFTFPTVSTSGDSSSKFPPENRCRATDKNQKCSLYAVSIIELLCRPELYHMKKVRVVGFVHFEFEGNAIWIHKDDYKNSLSRNALWLNIFGKEPKSLNDSYVIIEGTFDATIHGHMGMFSGTITNITRIDKWH